MTRAQGAAERLPALGSRDFRLLVAGQLVSYTGTQMQHVAVAWHLYVLTRSPLALGMLGLFRVLPVIVLALGGGVVADAVDRRRLMLGSQSVMALSSGILAASALTGHTSPAVIYACAFLTGTANAFDGPARQGLLAQLVPPEHLPSAVSVYTSAFHLGRVLGPSLGGIGLAYWGVGAVYSVDTLSFSASLLALGLLTHRAPPASSGLSLSAVTAGLRFVRSSPVIWSTMLIDFLATLFGGSLLLLPIYADQLLAVGPRGLGVLYAAQPIGAALAAFTLAARPPIGRRFSSMLISVALYGAAIAAFGQSRWFVPSLLCLALAGAADTVSTVIRQTVRQVTTPDALRGRVTAVNMMFFLGGPQLGELEAGLVARLYGVRASVTSGGLACVALALGCAWLAQRLRPSMDAPISVASPQPPR